VLLPIPNRIDHFLSPLLVARLDLPNPIPLVFQLPLTGQFRNEFPVQFFLDWVQNGRGRQGDFDCHIHRHQLAGPDPFDEFHSGGLDREDVRVGRHG
jgi:hypothetical protein